MKRSRPIAIWSTLFIAVILILSVSTLVSHLPTAIAGPYDPDPNGQAANMDHIVNLPIIVRPACAANHPLIDFGRVSNGNISSPVENKTYSFCGRNGDLVRFDISRTSGSFTPQLEIFNAAGSLICNESTNFSALSIICTLTTNGTFNLLVSDWGQNNTGGYGLYVQRLNNPTGAEPIVFGDVNNGSLSSVVQHNTYSIDANEGDIMRFDISQTSGNFNPQVDIYRPDGTLLCTEPTNFTTLSAECVVDTGGIHTILIGDWGLNSTGGYAFYFQRLNNPAGPSPINFGDVNNSSLSSVVQHNTYSIDVDADDIMRFDISQTSGNFNPQVDIYRPDGTLLCTEPTNFTTLSAECVVDTGGIHTILIGDWGLNSTGGYAFYFQRLNDPSGAAPINLGDVKTGALTSIVEHHAYTITVAASDMIRLEMSRTSGAITPQVDVYRPDGTRLCGESTNFASLSFDCTIDTSGVHTILIGDWGLNSTGGYSLSLTSLN